MAEQKMIFCESGFCGRVDSFSHKLKQNPYIIVTDNGSLRVRLELETGLNDYALAIMATGIVGFNGDKTPIIDPNLVSPPLHSLLATSKPFQHFVRYTLAETFGVRAGWGKVRGEELAEAGMCVLLEKQSQVRWRFRVLEEASYPTR